MLILTGPTGVGKSSLALSVAEAVGGEIISADSRQVYEGLDVGTAKPSASDRARVPHHLVGMLALEDSYSAGSFRADVERAITDLESKQTPVLVVGGSTLYVHALVHGLADLPNVSARTSAGLAARAESPHGRRDLYNELMRADPVSAATLDETKSQRLIRLVGLLRETGRPPSELWRAGRRPPIPHRLIVLDRPRSELYERIERRVDDMIEHGWVGEVEDLLSRDPSPRALLESTIGYREIVTVLAGTGTMVDAIDEIKRNTRRYAKRQLTWFRRYADAMWLDGRTKSVSDVLDAAAPWPART